MMCADTAKFALSLSVVLVLVCGSPKSPQSQPFIVQGLAPVAVVDNKVFVFLEIAAYVYHTGHSTTGLVSAIPPSQTLARPLVSLRPLLCRLVSCGVYDDVNGANTRHEDTWHGLNRVFCCQWAW